MNLPVEVPGYLKTGNVIFSRFFDFFVKDLREFYGQNNFQRANWETVKSSMLNDKDILNGSCGEITKRILANN